jgi:hypothetical protein
MMRFENDVKPRQRPRPVGNPARYAISRAGANVAHT